MAFGQVWPLSVVKQTQFAGKRTSRLEGPLRRGFLLPTSPARVHKHPMSDLPDIEDAKLMLGAAAVILGEDHAATLALAKAVSTRKAADIESSRLALCSLPRDQRRAIAEMVEQAWEGEDA